MAIVVDGTSQPVRSGDLTFPATRVARYRPLGGVVIAMITAIVTAGAMGPAAPAPDTAKDATAAACAQVAAAEADSAEPSTPAAVDAAGDVVEAWWRLPGPARWVDPSTGLTVQIDPAAPAPVVVHRVRDH